jgi:hypothetical protein
MKVNGATQAGQSIRPPYSHRAFYLAIEWTAVLY